MTAERLSSLLSALQRASPPSYGDGLFTCGRCDTVSHSPDDVGALVMCTHFCDVRTMNQCESRGRNGHPAHSSDAGCGVHVPDAHVPRHEATSILPSSAADSMICRTKATGMPTADAMSTIVSPSRAKARIAGTIPSRWPCAGCRVRRKPSVPRARRTPGSKVPIMFFMLPLLVLSVRALPVCILPVCILPAPALPVRALPVPALSVCALLTLALLTPAVPYRA